MLMFYSTRQLLVSLLWTILSECHLIQHFPASRRENVLKRLLSADEAPESYSEAAVTDMFLRKMTNGGCFPCQLLLYKS